MVASFFASNSNFIAAEFRNVKTSASSRQSYGDDAIGYVQLRRDSNMCTLKCKVCPEHRVQSKSYSATMVVDEEESKVVSVQCHDCAASQGGCKHAVAFLMWTHRRSEEPSCTSVDCYWKKSTLSQVGTTLKFISAKQLSKAVPTTTGSQDSLPLLLTEFIKEAEKRQTNSCLILKHQPGFELPELETLSLHYLIIKYSDSNCTTFLNNISHIFTQSRIDKLEVDTRGQHTSNLWHEMRYGRITGSIAYGVRKCKTVDGSLIATIMGARTIDTKAMKRGRNLEQQVKELVSKKLQKKIEPCGLIISKEYPYIAATPDGICDKTIVIEIKCPSKEKTFRNYIKDNKITERYMAQIQVQMFVSNLKKCYFCVADWNFENSGVVHILVIDYDQAYVKSIIQDLKFFWISNIYPLLYQSIE